MSANTIKTEIVQPSSFETVKRIDDPEIIAQQYTVYLTDESRIDGGHADWLFFPTTEQDVVAIMKKMAETNTPITIEGARTGIVGGAVPIIGGAIISMERMNKIKGLGYDEQVQKWFIRLEPGVTLNELKAILKQKKIDDDLSIPPDSNAVKKFKEDKKRYFYPVAPTEMSAAIGGTIATNASGATSFKYGPTRDWVRRLRVVLSNGEVLDITRGQYKAQNGIFKIQTSSSVIEVKIPTYEMPKAKNAAGLYAKPDMDLIDLFIGSEGLFGIITEADVWLTEYHEVFGSIVFFDEDDKALNFVSLLRESQDIQPEFIEYFDRNALELLKAKQREDPKFVNMPTIFQEAVSAISFDFPYHEDTIIGNLETVKKLLEECNANPEMSWCGYEDRELERFKHFRHAVPEIVNNIIAERKKTYPHLHKLGTDMSVTNEHLVDMMHFYHQVLQEEGLEYAIWGHIGDNHVHVNILPRNMEELEKGKAIYKKFAHKAVEYGGSVSAEHGIGKIKHEYLKIMFGEEGINEMRRVKEALDPKYLLCVNNMFPKEA